MTSVNIFLELLFVIMFLVFYLVDSVFGVCFFHLDSVLRVKLLKALHFGFFSLEVIFKFTQLTFLLENARSRTCAKSNLGPLNNRLFEVELGVL